MNTAQVLDLLLTLAASGCLLFLVYGAWLCLHARLGVPEGAQQPGLSSRTERVERSAVQT